MSRRWSILGVTTSLSVFLVGQMLERIAFPFNFQAMFLFLSMGGLLSYYYSSHITIPDNQPPESIPSGSIVQSLRNYFSIMKVERGFLPFVTKRFVFMTGVTLAAPLFPIYFVKDLSAANDMIATLATAESASLVVGYFFWVRFSRGSGSRKILLASTLGLVLYPLLTAFTHNMQIIALYAAVSGFFTAGLNLVFFDELLKRVPLQYSATLISFAQSFQYLSSIIAPFIGTLLAGWIGVGPALLFSAGLRLVGFALFALDRPQKTD
jgi:MFS family permease